MTRINLIPVSELSDQHLLAEYRELPRIIKQKIDVSNAPERYCLGKGHMKWAKRHSPFCIARYKELCEEMIYRGFKVNYPYTDLYEYYINDVSSPTGYIYFWDDNGQEISRNRIIEKIKQKPNWYRWTNRPRPSYAN